MATRTRKVATSVSLSTVIQKVATARKINATDAGKRTRAYIRAHKVDLLKVWPALKDHGHGDRYGDMPTPAADTILAAIGKSK